MKEDLTNVLEEALDDLVENECITLLAPVDEVVNYLVEYVMDTVFARSDEENTTDYDSDDDWDEITDRS